MYKILVKFAVACSFVYFAHDIATATVRYPSGCVLSDVGGYPSPNCYYGVSYWDCSQVGGPRQCAIMMDPCDDSPAFDSCNCPTNPWNCT